MVLREAEYAMAPRLRTATWADVDVHQVVEQGLTAEAPWEN
ncbi:hypothetical protein J2T11_001094 [Paenarthrobacter nicotinovorans]|nr:hypothetical protein [Paenarthrobacter nicotinovorans]